ncbi:MAG: leucyl aminopeptidase [Acidimicrobiaceae bacterium]|jgi:leucyl aminopeptidase|nr:leucyl aminopeptidase [Acidimicrobiaceae bacterium]
MPLTVTAAPDVPADVEVLGVPVFAGRVVAPGSPIEFDLAFLEASGFEGKVGETTAVMAEDGTTAVAVGVGPQGDVGRDDLRRAAAAFVKVAGRRGRAAFSLPPGSGLDTAEAAQAVAEGSGMGAYQFSRYKSSPKDRRLESLVVVGGDERAVARGAAVAGAVTLARDLINEPAGAMTPTKLAEAASEMAAAAGIEITVMDEATIEDEGLGGLRGVSLGSEEPPRLIQLTWSPSDGTAAGTVVLVGKGITFDSGGLSLKSGDGMMTMKTDMSGAAAVLGAMSALPVIAPNVRVVGIIPATENMPSGRAIKPGDVLTFRNGKTAEVLNTDAEGRLVLADGLSLAAEMEPDAIVDLATLTGAVSVALGKEIAAVMGNDDGFVGQVLQASERGGEPMWQLPLPERYRKHLDSEVADMKNIGNAGQAGTLVAGLFLKEFVGDVPWAHIDIAGTARSDSDDGYLTKGGTGAGVRTVLELLEHFESPRP